MKIVFSLWQETILTLPKRGFQRLPSFGGGPNEHLSFAIKVYRKPLTRDTGGKRAELASAANFSSELVLLKMFKQRLSSFLPDIA